MAVDGEGGNSPFARAFVTQIRVPGREVRRLFDYVRDDVQRATGRRQQSLHLRLAAGEPGFLLHREVVGRKGRRTNNMPSIFRAASGLPFSRRCEAPAASPAA